MSSGPGPRGGAPTERARNFTGTWRRLISELRPEMRRIALVVALTVIAVVLSVAAPKILARATNILFEGVMGSMLARAGVPEGTTGDRLARMLRAGGRDDYADMVSAYDVVVGRAPAATPRPGRPSPELLIITDADKSASKVHCAVRVEDWDLAVEDLGSSNGTFLLRPGRAPRRLAPHSPEPLAVGDVISLADAATLTVEDADE